MLDFEAYFRADRPFFILGPCVIEGRDMIFRHAEFLKKLCETHNVPFVFKSSFNKANRSSYVSYRGVGIEKGLAILAEVKKEFDVPVCTDIHETAQAKVAAEVIDLLQIPAFLSRQTDLLVAAALTGKAVSIKKGQFLSPHDIAKAAEKAQKVGNSKIVLIERGTSFGYNNLVVDCRSFPIMKETGLPVAFDATHSVQLPSAHGTHSGGERQYVFPLAKAAVAAGAMGIFAECHENPDIAKSDAATQIPLHEMSYFITEVKNVYEKSKNNQEA